MELEKILEKIKKMRYDELERLSVAIGCRIAKLDKYEDMRREALEDMYRDAEDYEYPQI
jgi:hypothetical protein